MSAALARRLPALLGLALAACGATDEPAPGTVLSFVRVPGMACADGSGTGLGVSSGSNDVLLYLAPGGACWGATCNASRGPLGAAELSLAAQALLPGSILDRSLPGNPFARFTLVLVPYCTGDVHAGDAVRTWGGQTWRHRGHANLVAALDWLEANRPRPARVVVAGSSAGGFGALLAYDLVRTRWPVGATPAVSAGLLDDSAPTFDPPALATALPYAWWDAWNLASTVDPLCPTCRDRLSDVWATLAGRYRNDLMALLSSETDLTMRGFFGGLTGTEFTAGLTTLGGVLAPLGNVRTFTTAGSDHALLLSPARFAAGGRSLLGWLDPIAAGTGAFTSAP